MNDESGKWNDEEKPEIVLLAINSRYFLYQGDEFLTPMLTGQGFFPRPVRCVTFDDAFEVNVFLGRGLSIAEFWGINPDIVERLRRDEDLLEIRYSDN